jgi:hypothetical protein
MHAKRHSLPAICPMDGRISNMHSLLTLGPGEDPSDRVLAAIIGTLYDALLSRIR